LYLASQRHLAALRAHLNAARFVFPSDPVIAFISGCLHEALSAPDLQMAGQYYARAGGRGGTIDSAEKNLDEATTYFRRAVEFDPDFVEARIHLGRVLRLQSHHDQSANELRRAIASAEDPLLAYFGHLFLADTEQARGHDDVARESALRAAGLFPRAQSPHLALAYLARRRGEREAAERALEGCVEPVGTW
jgi:tetratricopeptide (TPR) repeat protein